MPGKPGNSDVGGASLASDIELIRDARREVEAAKAAGPLGDGSDSPAGCAFTPPPPQAFAGYQIIREIHRGGQGVVYQAMEEATGCEVALKVMKQGPFAGPADRARFDREIQILRQLDHNNIATIREVGVADGGLFFVMDYVPGRPLDGYVSQTDSNDQKAILRLFAKICDAVNAAHLRGVIHRDLKPANIRVDDDGEPHVLDFGLAKVTGEGSSARTAPKTATGQFVGSLPWSSPEQAEGRPDKIDIRTDVYSLGVILYQLLTGRFPYDVLGNMRDVLDRIIRLEPTRPRIANREIGDEVETILLKCLAKEPERRYQSAGELAKDIERYLTGEPIEAKRDSAAYVLRKQLHKHKLPVAVAAAFLIVIFAGLAVSLAFWQQAVHERDVAQAARLAETEQRERAEANFQKARDAVDQMLSEVGHTDLADVPLMEPVRKALLERALGFYQDFLKEQSDDPPLMYETALAYKRVADIHGLLGSNEKSDEHYQQAAALFDRLASRIEQQPDQRERLAETLTHIAQIRKTLHQDEQAEQTYIRALAAWEALAAAEPAKPDFARQVAARHYDLAVLMARNSRTDQALTEYRSALRLNHLLAAEFPAEPHYAFEIAVCHNAMGTALAANGRYAETLDDLQSAVDGFAMLAAADPDDDNYRIELSRSQFNQGYVLQRLERYDEAEEALRASARLREKLAADFPHRPMYRQKHANSLNDLGAVFWKTDRLDQAEQTYRRVLQVQEGLVEQFPGVAEFEHMLGGTLHNLAILLVERGDAAGEPDKRVEAKPLLERAIDHQDRAIKFNPNEPWYRQFLHNHYQFLFDVLQELGRLAEAEAAARHALQISRKLADEFPDQIQYRSDVADDLYNLGNRLRESHRWTESEAAYREAIALYQELAEQSPDVPQYRRNAALAQDNLDTVLDAAGHGNDE